ncbi:hypothetical protein S40285_02968 [Stachybotrys chlorohalonatus IBT 40285]|uniref:Uncharacterized protein n=1 Tax=Stachybotrys chlorohalonatus (strain IBT 40285) TaxID=1283841 RepID=A0A084QT03_STAC4|nr:hypothetical protein S40285_02968 [Stachybotrys chlorohalonata IBT 40285]
MDPEVVTILLVGDEKCGKTTFLSRLSAGENTNPIPLLRDFDQPFNFDIKLSPTEYRLHFYDTSSPENWRLLDPDVVIICYDISQRLSLINMKRYVGAVSALPSVACLLIDIRKWIDEVKKSFTRIDRLPIIVLGLKRDLRSETDPNGVIYPNEAYQLAQTMRVDRYVECSAVTGELIRPAFEDICKTAAKTKGDTGGQSEAGCTVM